MDIRAIIAILLIVASPALHAADALQFSASAGYVADDNITRAERDSDILSDTVLGLEGAAAWALPLNKISYLRLRGTAKANQYQDFSKLSSNRLGFEAVYYIKPAPGFTAMEYFLRAAYEERKYDQNNQREGAATRFGLGLGKRLTDLVSMRLVFSSEDIEAEEQKFATDGNRISLDLDYVLTGNNLLYLTLSRYDGDVVSIVKPPVTGTPFAGNTDFVLDFGLPKPMLGWWWAYKLDGTINAVTLGGAYAIDRSQGVDASVYFYDTEAGVNNYSGLIFSLYYTYNF